MQHANKRRLCLCLHQGSFELSAHDGGVSWRKSAGMWLSHRIRCTIFEESDESLDVLIWSLFHCGADDPAVGGCLRQSQQFRAEAL